MTDAGKRISRNNSLLYFALLCLAIYLVQFRHNFLPSRSETPVDTHGKIYVEVDDGTFSTVKILSNRNELKKIASLYNIHGKLRNGSKVILDNEKKLRTGRISGLKSLSLGIPIGINSASAEDLEALPGIGEKLALRIVAYRNESGWFEDTDDLIKVNGMGEKKLALIRPLISLD